jgi:uncharacterized protein (TIGR02217 family)
MAHLDAYLDRCPGFGWEAAPRFNTLIVPLRNKRTRRNAEWSQPEWRFGVPFTNNLPEHYEQVLDMFMVCRGRLHAFRVRNWLNYRATAWRFGTGDGVTEEFQLGKRITVDGESYLNEIHALSIATDAPTPVAYVNGVATAATFDDRTGKVLFAAPPALGAALTWTGWFDYWVRFAADDLPYTIDNRSNGEFVVNGQAELEETEAPDEGFST